MATALGWTLDLIRQDVDTQQKLFQETRSNKCLNSAKLGQISDLANLKLAMQIVKSNQLIQK